MNYKFSTKARTLDQIKFALKNACVPKLFFFDLKTWKKNKSLCLEQINKNFKDSPLIIRSSAISEDNLEKSNAGKYVSLLNVNKHNMENAIERVFKSYEIDHDKDEILVQPMLQNVIRSGVIFSHDPNTCSPYRVINWSESQDTTSVTSGYGGKTWVSAAGNKWKCPKKIEELLKLLDELLLIFKNSPIDCEFAVTREKHVEKLWLLQVRPLILRNKPEKETHQTERLKVIEKQLKRTMGKHHNLLGDKTVYGVMPDWNPAEIIGIRPRPLALSLYRELITDKIRTIK